MEPNGRSSDQDENTGSVDGESADSAPRNEAMHASPPEDDEEEGQLGPDELPDPVEVVMNHEAKTHK
jgi:hypothetical protein